MKPLLYLEIRQFLNAIKNTLKSPKRLIPMLFAGASMVAWFLQNMLAVSGNSMRMGHNSPSVIPIDRISLLSIEAIVFVLMSVGIMAVIYGAFNSGMLVFSIAQIDFLFPTPVSRRSVLVLKLLKDYLKYGFYVSFFTIFVGMPLLSAMRVSFWPYGLVSIASLTALMLLVTNLAHTINIVFTFGFERLRQAGLVIKLVLAAALASVIGYAVNQYLRTGDTSLSLLWAANSPFVNTVFAPAKWCAELFVSPLRQFVKPDGWFHFFLLWSLAAASFFLLLSRRENIYEPSLGVSAKFARMRHARRTGDVSSIRLNAMQEKGTKRIKGPSIPPFGQGAVAILWKNLLVKYRMSMGQMILLILLPCLLVYVARAFAVKAGISTALLKGLPFLLIYVAAIVSITVQMQMRNELRYANILKAMPIAAWKVMLAQVAYEAIYLAAGVLLFASAMWFIVPESRGNVLWMCAVGAPFIGFVTMSVSMIPSLLYPDTRDATQNFICQILNTLLTGIALIPTIVLGITLIALNDTPYWLAMIAISITNIIVGGAAVSIAGSIFRRFDPTGE